MSEIEETLEKLCELYFGERDGDVFRVDNEVSVELTDDGVYVTIELGGLTWEMPLEINEITTAYGSPSNDTLEVYRRISDRLEDREDFKQVMPEDTEVSENDGGRVLVCQFNGAKVTLTPTGDVIYVSGETRWMTSWSNVERIPEGIRAERSVVEQKFE